MNREYLMEAFDYDANTGVLTWKERPLSHFANSRSRGTVNTKMVGAVAGRKKYQKKGGAPHALELKVGQKLMHAHRVAWTIANGEIPKGAVIDHVNGNPFDNRLCNLRIATYTQNAQNRKLSKSNSTGLKGVSVYRSWFKVSIRAGGKSIHLGYHKTKGMAALAYAKASLKYHGQFARIS